jgi:hypothetical protein
VQDGAAIRCEAGSGGEDLQADADSEAQGSSMARGRRWRESTTGPMEAVGNSGRPASTTPRILCDG